MMTVFSSPCVHDLDLPVVTSEREVHIVHAIALLDLVEQRGVVCGVGCGPIKCAVDLLEEAHVLGHMRAPLQQGQKRSTDEGRLEPAARIRSAGMLMGPPSTSQGLGDRSNGPSLELFLFLLFL